MDKIYKYRILFFFSSSFHFQRSHTHTDTHNAIQTGYHAVADTNAGKKISTQILFYSYTHTFEMIISQQKSISIDKHLFIALSLSHLYIENKDILLFLLFH